MISKKKIDDNFFEVIQKLNQIKINYWICHGTLLGIVREGSLIEWDHDIDIAVWFEETSKEKIMSIMEKMGFKLREGFGVEDDLVSFEKQGGRVVDFSFLKKKIQNNQEVAYVTYHFPKNVLMKCVNALSYSDRYSGKFKQIIRLFSPVKFIFRRLKKKLIQNNFFYKEFNLYVPTKLLNNFIFLETQQQKIRIPKKYEEYLTFLYGLDWKTPKRNFIFPRNYKTF